MGAEKNIGNEKKAEAKRAKTAAVVLAAGRGKRMKSDVPKQYLLLNGRPLICYALKVFQDSFIDEIVLVTEAGEEERCRRQIVEPFGFSKVTAVAAGGSERYFSVANGLKIHVGQCAMDSYKLDKSMIWSCVEVVPSATLDLVQLQNSGFAYMKV